MKSIIILSHVTFDSSPYCMFVHEHAKELVKAGYKVYVVATLSWFPCINLIRNRKKQYKEKKGLKVIDGVTVIYKKRLSFSNLLYDSKINLNGISYYLATKKLIKKIIKNNNVVFIDAHMFKEEGYVAEKIKRKYNILTSVTLHGSSFHKNFLTKNGQKEIKRILGNIDYTICVSPKIQKEVASLGVNNTRIIYNGVKDYNLKNSEKRQKFSVFSVANLVKCKNIDIVIKAIAILIKKYEKLQYTIIGDGVEKVNLENLVKSYGIKKNVKFLGYINNETVLKKMQENEIFILPSSPEGFGIVYVEAMRSKCITIGTKGEGIDGFIIHEKNGFLVEPDVDKIVKLVTNIYENKYNINIIQNNAYDSSINLTWKNNASKYLELLNLEKEEENE